MRICLLSLILIALGQLGFAQNTMVSDKTDTSAIFIYEKVYLHTDRSFYYAGDDIWFKSYLVDAFSNQLIIYSNILYVELIAPNATIIQRHNVRLANGTGIGDFHLPDSLPAGHYWLRAYTNRMKNFGSNFIYTKEITVENAMAVKDSTRQTTTAASVDVQFFPESGSLVDEVYSAVAFKSVNSNGLGCNVQGWVISSKGDTAAQFQTEHLGMGSFSFKPEKGLTYYASGKTENGLSFTVDLPQSFAKGVVLRIKPNDKRLLLTLKINNETLQTLPSTSFNLEGFSRNRLCIKATFSIKSLVNVFVLPTDAFPEGIARLVVYGADKKALCERLVYIEKQDHPTVSVKPDKTTYSTRATTSIAISITDSIQKPVLANLSMAVVDRSVLKNPEPYTSDIASYFFLESEIKGNIEQPGYYFDPLQPNRFKDMELLLLTQGWRDFLWKYIPDTALPLKYPLEEGFTISGYLRRLFINKPIAKANISIGLFDGKSHFFTVAQTDTMGRFAVEGIDFTGKKTVVVTATNKAHKTQGWISIDSVAADCPAISLPVSSTEKLTPEVVINMKHDALYKSAIRKKYSLTDTIALKEVMVKQKKIEKSKEEEHSRIYGQPDDVIKVTDQLSGFTDIFQLLQGRVAGLMVKGMYPNVSVSIRGGGSPLFLLDEIPVDVDMISSISVNDVDRVEVLKNGGSTAVFGMRGGNGVISVFLKKGGGTSMANQVYHSVNTKISGYTAPRVFYTPKYDKPKRKDEQPDLRTTIHWEPSITTGGADPVKIQFENADRPAKIEIDLQGITQSGIPVTGRAEYEVK